MNKKMNYIFVIAFLVLLLVGCGKQQAQDDSNNKYKLPLGDSGYLTEMDFALTKNKEIKNTNGDIVTTITYDYVENNKTCAVKIKARVMDEKFDNKSIKLAAGYYHEDDFIPYDDGVIINLSCADYNEYEYTFTFGSDAETKVDESGNDTNVLKISLGTSIDEEYYKNTNPGAKKSEIKKYTKKYRSALVKINELTFDNNNILVDTYEISGTISYIAKVNSDLYYYNTAVVEYASDTLTITLNCKYNWWQWIIDQLGKLLFWITNVVGGYYWLGLLIFTLALRTIGWPIYAKSNSATNGMSKIQPEMEKINKKYEGKTDQNSKMKQQMEIKELMKKNHVSVWGCLLPFAQMPIFFAVYQVVQRFPLTPIYAKCNYDFLWTTFAMDYGQASGSWVLAIIVGITMIGSQLLSMQMTKKIQKKTSNFYTAKNQQNNNQMLIMMGVMTVMMVAFAWKSSGIAFYWIIGNVYQIAQTAISKHQEEKRTEKELEITKKVRGR